MPQTGEHVELARADAGYTRDVGTLAGKDDPAAGREFFEQRRQLDLLAFYGAREWLFDQSQLLALAINERRPEGRHRVLAAAPPGVVDLELRGFPSDSIGALLHRLDGACPPM